MAKVVEQTGDSEVVLKKVHEPNPELAAKLFDLGALLERRVAQLDRICGSTSIEVFADTVKEYNGHFIDKYFSAFRSLPDDDPYKKLWVSAVDEFEHLGKEFKESNRISNAIVEHHGTFRKAYRERVSAITEYILED